MADPASEYPPNFIGKLRGPSEVSEGQQLILECDVTGNPRPAVNWFCDDRSLLVGKGVAISFINNKCRLTVSGMTTAMSGVYMCRLSNPHGKAVDSCPVTVRPAAAGVAANGCSRTTILRNEKQPASLRIGSELKMDIGVGSKSVSLDRTSDGPAGRSPAFGQHILKKADGASLTISGAKTSGQTAAAQPPWAGVMHDLKHPPTSPSAAAVAARGITATAPLSAAAVPAVAGSRSSADSISASRSSEPASPVTPGGSRGRIVRGNSSGSSGEQSPAAGESSFQSSIKIQTKPRCAGSPGDQVLLKGPAAGLTNGSLLHVRPGEEVQFVVAAGPSATPPAALTGTRKQQSQHPAAEATAAAGLTAAGLLLLQSRAKAHSVEDLRRAFAKDGDGANSLTLRPPATTAAFSSTSGSAAFAPAFSTPSSSVEGVYVARLAAGRDGDKSSSRSRGGSGSSSCNSVAGQPASSGSQPRLSTAASAASTISLPSRIEVEGGGGSSGRSARAGARPVSVVGLPTATADPALGSGSVTFAAGRGSMRQTAANSGGSFELQRQASAGASVQQRWQQPQQPLSAAAERSVADDSGSSGRTGRQPRSTGPTTTPPPQRIEAKTAVQQAAASRPVTEPVSSATAPVTARVSLATATVGDSARLVSVAADATLRPQQQQQQHLRRLSTDSADTSESSASSVSSLVGDARADGTAGSSSGSRVYADVTDYTVATATAVPAANSSVNKGGISRATAVSVSTSSIGSPAVKLSTPGYAGKENLTTAGSSGSATAPPQPLLRSTSSDASVGGSPKTVKSSNNSLSAVANDGVKLIANHFAASNADCAVAGASLSQSTGNISASPGGRSSASLSNLANGESTASRGKPAAVLAAAAAAIGGSDPTLSEDSGRRRAAGCVSQPPAAAGAPAASSGALPRKNGSRRDSSGSNRTSVNSSSGGNVAGSAGYAFPVAVMKMTSPSTVAAASPPCIESVTQPLPAAAALRTSPSRKSAATPATQSATSGASVSSVELHSKVSGLGGGQQPSAASGSKVAAITSKLSQQQPDAAVPSNAAETSLSNPIPTPAASSSTAVSAALRKYDKSREAADAFAAEPESVKGTSSNGSVSRRAAVTRTKSDGSDLVKVSTPTGATSKVEDAPQKMHLLHGQQKRQQQQQQEQSAPAAPRLTAPTTAVTSSPAATNVAERARPPLLSHPASVSMECSAAASVMPAADAFGAGSAAATTAAAAVAFATPSPPIKSTAVAVAASSAAVPPVKGGHPSAECRMLPVSGGAVVIAQQELVEARCLADASVTADGRMISAVGSSLPSGAAAGRQTTPASLPRTDGIANAATTEVLPSVAAQSQQCFDAAKAEGEASRVPERITADDLKKPSSAAENLSIKDGEAGKKTAANTSSTAAAATSAPSTGSDAWWIKRKAGGKALDSTAESIALAAETPADPKRQLRPAGIKGSAGGGSSSEASGTAVKCSSAVPAAHGQAVPAAKDAAALSDSAVLLRVRGIAGPSDTVPQQQQVRRKQQQQGQGVGSVQTAAAGENSRCSGISLPTSGDGRQFPMADVAVAAGISADRDDAGRMCDGGQTSATSPATALKSPGPPTAAVSSSRAPVASDATPSTLPSIVAAAEALPSGHSGKIDAGNAATSSAADPSVRAAASLSPTRDAGSHASSSCDKSAEKVAVLSSSVVAAPVGAATAPSEAAAALTGDANSSPIGTSADAATPTVDGIASSTSAAAAAGAPRFVIRPRTQYVKKGQTATLRCLAEGQPKPTVEWQHFGTTLTPSSKYKMYVKNDFSCLDIVSADAADHGEYICIIANAVGSVQSSVELDVSGVVRTSSPSVTSAAASVVSATSAIASKHSVGAHGPGVGIDAVGQRTVVPVESSSHTGDIAVTLGSLPSRDPSSLPSSHFMSQDGLSCDLDKTTGQQSKQVTAGGIGNTDTGLTRHVAGEGAAPSPAAAASSSQISRGSLGSRLQMLSEHYSADVDADDAARATKPAAQRPRTGDASAGCANGPDPAVDGGSDAIMLSPQQLALRRKLDALGSDALAFAAELDARGSAAKERRSGRTTDLLVVDRGQIADGDIKARGERAGPDGCEAGGSDSGSKILLTDAVVDDSSADDVVTSPLHGLSNVIHSGGGPDARASAAAEPPFRAPRFTKLLENQELTEGDSVTIECVKSPGSSVSTVTAAQQKDGDDEDLGAADTGQDLDGELRSLDLSGEGGTGSLLDVTCVPGACEEGAADCPPDTPPIFVRTLVDSTVVEGQAVELVAEVFGTEPIDIVWVHNDEELSTDNPDYHLIREGRLCRLLITDVFVEDAGTYICEAYNKFGDCDTACSLTVRAKGGAEPPSFLSPLPATLTVMEGSTVSLCCRISNVDPLDVTWSKNGRMARQGQRFKVSGENDSFSYEIQHVLATDAGTYEVNAANDYGTVSCQCSVNVSSATPTEETDVKELLRQKRLERAALMNASRPKFLELLQDVEVAEGKGLSLSCRIDGSPAPDVQWYIDGREVKQSANVMLSYENKLAQLEIRETAASEHQGRYTCVATNKEGQEKTTGSVTIKKARSAYTVPNPPVGKPFVTDVTSQAMTVAWYGPDFDGGTPVICYKVEMCKLSLLKISQDKFWKTLTDQCKHTSYRVTSLVADAEYVFRVRAINSVGESVASDWSESAIATDRRLSTLSDSESQFETESLYSEYSEYSEYAESEYDYDLDEAFSDHVAEIRNDVAFDDQYDIKTLLGKGKFGAVYLCTEKSTGREWAAKRIKCRPSQKSEIMNEIDIMNELRHPKLVRLWEVFEGSKEMVLVTEYVSGGELFERIAGDDFDLTETDCVRFTKQICDGVQYMHEKCILHLDLKPENIICTKRDSNQIKLIDFGLARRYKNGESMKVMFGTPEFVAPEVINFEPIDFATDMWSIGVITYVLLSGLSPFCGDTDSETLSNVTKAQWEFDEDAFADISLCAKDFVTKLLLKRKEHRMSAADCCRHMWLADSKPQRTRKLRKSKEKMKKFVARRKWQVTRELDAGRPSASARKQAAQADSKSVGSVSNGSEAAKANGKGPPSRVEQQPGVVGGQHGRHFKSDDSGYEGTNAVASYASSAANAVPLPAQGVRPAADDEQLKAAGYEDEPAEPAFVRPLVDTSVVEGMGICISCEVRAGGPAPAVAWFKDGAKLPLTGDGYRCLSDGCRLSLIIDKAKVTDDAEYECRVANDAGETSSFAELYVTPASS